MMVLSERANPTTRVMVISTVGLIYDGITGVILSYLESMDLRGLEIYVAGTIDVHPDIREKIETLGCRVVNLPSRRTNPFQYFCSLIAFLRRNNISVIHAHGNSGTLAIEMVAGWLGGCKKRIAHSHNTRCDQVRADRMLRPVFNAFYTDALACGEDAGKWLYGDRPFTVLRNGRSIEKYRFNNAVRARMRRQYGIADDTLVLGHVGHFTEQKNQDYVIDVYRELLKIQPSVRLFLIGEGPLRHDVEIKAAGLRDKVTFVGTTDHVPDYLQMMDVMILPSRFEGLPLVSIEWQINGIPAILADTITRQCALTDLVQFKSLHDTPAEWATGLVELAERTNREQSAEQAPTQVARAGYDMAGNAATLRTLYLSKGTCS